MKTNPVLRNAFDQKTVTSDTMTLEGAFRKTGLLLVILIAAAIYSFTSLDMTAFILDNYILAIIGIIGLSLLVRKFKEMSPTLAIIYAIVEGLIVGAISAAYEYMYGGIVLNAVMATIGVLVVMLILHKTGTIKATKKFNSVIAILTSTVMLVYLTTFVLGIFNISVPYIHSSGPIGIIINGAIIILAALNLIRDFDYIEKGAASNQPKYMEWYSGFSLMVTIIWIYLEVLRFLGKLRRD